MPRGLRGKPDHPTQKWIAISALCLTIILTSCEKPAPPDTREADAKAIREPEGTWSKMMGTKDAAKFASSYADEAALYITVSSGLKWQHSRWF